MAITISKISIALAGWSFPTRSIAKNLSRVTLLGFLVSYALAQNAQPDISATINASLSGKIFRLRGFYTNSILRFDRAGNITGNPKIGSWTTALVEIKQTTVSDKHVELKGLRWTELYDLNRNKFVEVPTRIDQELVVDYDPSETAADVINAINHAFLQSNDRMADLVPDYWKPFVSNAIETIAQEKGADCTRIKGELVREVDGNVERLCEKDAFMKSSTPPPSNYDLSSIPYKVDKQVIAPQPQFTPDPEYSDVAASAKISGTVVVKAVVETNGLLSQIYIARPIGFGLDDEAANALKKWRFSPATLKNRPVPARVTIQVDFHR